MESLEVRLKAHAADLGFQLCGIATADPSRHTDYYASWLSRGAHGEMGYLSRADAVARRADLTLTMPSAKSVIVVAHEYFNDDAATDAATDASTAVIARYARGRDYHKVVKKKLLSLLEWLRQEVHAQQGGGVEGRAYVDTGPLLERELGARAGLGWFGKNTMLIHPRRGSWFFLGCLLVDLELTYDEPIVADHCGSCSSCLNACPTGALQGRDERGAPRIDARLCISYLTIENRGPIPRDLRPALGNRIYGCDICQEACPWNAGKFVHIAVEPRYRSRARGQPEPSVSPPEHTPDTAPLPPDPGTASPALTDLMGMDAAAWDAFSRGSAIRRAGRSGFLRNVAVALGNWASPDALPALTHALADDETLVRGHAAWALGRVGTREALAALQARVDIEPDAWVREELALALRSE